MSIRGLYACLILFVLSACGGGGGTSSGTVIDPGSTTTINTEHATLTVPAHTFSTSLTASLSESATAPDELTTSTAISPVVTMTFSDTISAETDASFSLAITVPEAEITAADTAGEAIYALVRESDDALGHIDLEDETAVDPFNWRIVFGTLDEATQTYTLPLAATSSTLDVVITRGADLYAYTGELDPDANRSPLFAVDALTWDTRPWMVICHAQTLGSDNEDACNPDAGEDFILDDALTSITNAAEFVAFLGWPDAKLHVMSKSDILERNLPTHPNLDAAADSDTYNVIFLSGRVPRAGADSRGGYFYDSGDIYVVPRAIDAGRQAANGNVFAHEIFHSIQAAVLPIPYASRTYLNDYLWFMESTAQVIGMFSLDGDEASLPDKKTNGTRRTWDLPLRSKEYFLTPYLTFEFFARLNGGDVDYLQDLFNFLSINGTGVDSYTDLQNTFGSLFDQTLHEVYTMRVMSQRGVESEENDCTYANITEELADDGEFTMLPGDAYALDISLTPMSSLCFDIFADREEKSLMRITVTSEDAEQHLLALGDEDFVQETAGINTAFTFLEQRGVVADPNIWIKTIGDNADIRIIRDAYSYPDSDARTWSIHFQNDFTGTWCASYEFDAARTPCEDYGTVLHLEEDDNGQLTGSGMIFVCEVSYPILTTLDASEVTQNDLVIGLDTSAIDTNADCDDFSATFSLTYTDGHLEGTWSLPERGPLTPAQTETLTLERVSVDPDYEVPFELNRL